MTFDEFIGQVQHRARLGTEGEAVRATRATLETLGERLFGGADHNLASQLPQEIGHYLMESMFDQDFGLDEFYNRVALREGGIDYPEAVFHARVVMSVLSGAVSPGALQHIRAQLPPEYNDLFSLTGGRSAA